MIESAVPSPQKDKIAPWMTEEEIRMLEAIVPKKEMVNVLEWGSGGSTVHFPKFLDSLGIEFSWLSLEYNKEWYEKVRVHIDKRITLKLFDSGSAELKPDYDFSKYVAYPGTLGKKFDFILVDGRWRRRCLIEASKLLSPGGVAVLHDAQRTWYHQAFSYFHYGFFLSRRLWLGFQPFGAGESHRVSGYQGNNMAGYSPDVQPSRVKQTARKLKRGIKKTGSFLRVPQLLRVF